MLTKNSIKKQNNFYCENCDYNAKRKTDYDKHIKSKKHNTYINDTEKCYKCSICSKIYKHRQSLYNHKKKCNPDTIQNDNCDNVNYKDLILKVLNENKTLQDLLIKQQELLIKQQEESNRKFENLVLHIKPNNTINNNKIINNNKTFNIMMFLNDKCKDAMTIQDFANNLVVSIEDLEKKKFDCLTNTILKNLKSLSVTQRPIHCGNIKKKEWYLNDKENGWELDNGEKLIKNTEYGINKKYKDEFKRHYPNYLTVETIQDKYMRLINTTLTDLPENEKSRLLNLLAKDLIIDNESI
jgi:hypothetical protein